MHTRFLFNQPIFRELLHVKRMLVGIVVAVVPTVNSAKELNIDLAEMKRQT